MRLETFIPIFIAFVVVIFSILISASVKSGKKKQQTKDPRKDAMRAKLEGREQGDPFADPLAPVEIRTESAPVRTYVTPSAAKAGVVKTGKAQSSVEGRIVAGTDLVETLPKVHTSAQVVGISQSHHDKHCDIGHSDEDEYIVEKVPVSGSIGGNSDEGCKEHYNLRFVKIEHEESTETKIRISEEEMRKAIILGEVINDPAFKKY